MIPDIPLLKHKDENNFFLIAGPCVIENEETPFAIAKTIKDITNKLKIPFIFKASYKKANRTHIDSFTGIGNIAALNILNKIRQELDIPVLTDIHTEQEAQIAAEYVDVLQIPAFLSRQTDLLIAAAETGKAVNIKKGQFMSSDSMKYALEKATSAGNKNIMLTERGSFFGYGDLIVDFRNIPLMKKFNHPVILDATHSLQQPNQPSGVSGGKPSLIETIAKAGIASGIDGLFIETHPYPKQAKSDGENMLELSLLENLLQKLIKIKKALQE